MALDIFGKMDIDLKVIASDITRSQNQYQNNLCELLEIVPAKPVKATEIINDSNSFSPKTDKYFIPKKRSKCNKVKTVRYIRQLLEKDIYSYLPSELEQQQAVLLKKIKDGSSNDESTKSLVKSMFQADKPLSRSVWEIMININPEQKKNSKQFVLWNGKYIQVNGSKGGTNKFICNYDLCKNRLQKTNILKKRTLNKKKGLLQHSLTVKFKPGPLRRKKYLDDSHQKYHVGSTELINLPKPGLVIQPTYGTSLDQTITSFVNNLRDESGIISQKWAEFAITVLGTEKNGNAVQNSEDTCIFDLKYKCSQNRILMRRDIDNTLDMVKVQGKREMAHHSKEVEEIDMLEVKRIMDNIIDSVEISLKQDNMYSREEELKQDVYVDSNRECQKEKSKRKYAELDRLDVTVIRLPDENQKKQEGKCGKLYCSLGCVCASINCPIVLKRHCGLVKCMFECKCDFSKQVDIDCLQTEHSDFLPGLLNLSNKVTEKLSKEEQKFHQTVIVSGEKSVLLKTKKRSVKSSKKYTDFYSDLNFKIEEKPKSILTVVEFKLNCPNIEPWCMVHNLYKCFCKGRFTETSINEIEIIGNNNIDNKKESTNGDTICDTENLNESNTFRTSSRRERKHFNKLSESSNSESSNSIGYDDSDDRNTCARVNVYEGRKYSEGYYKNINQKILELEINDHKLHKRMMTLLGIDEKNNKSNTQKSAINKSQESSSLVDIMNNTTAEIPVQLEKGSDVTSNKVKLVAWLESSYKHYKKREDQGIVKTSLDPPKYGKLALYPWDFVLSRYRERKNIFLISKHVPFRIFMAIDISHPFFDSCINIDEIRFADLNKYPMTVKNLLTNTTDNMKENFCILCGLSNCWELIGSVTKVNDEKEHNVLDGEIMSNPECASPNKKSQHKKNKISNLGQIFTLSEFGEHVIDEKNYPIELEVPNSDALNNHEISEQSDPDMHELPNSDSCKWFVMTVENDFSEIQFFTRGFFVKYESIVKAINVARMSGKTVRLSSQKCVEKNSGPQFGIYAIPNTNEYCVFVGPYEHHEPLGIETVKSILYMGKEKRTRGVWMTIDKTDNLKVIDNPLSYMPSTSNTDFNEMLPLEADANLISENNLPNSANNNTKPDGNKEVLNTPTSSKPRSKTVKPIKIRKADGFFHLSSESLIKQLSLQKYPKSTSLLKTSEQAALRIDTSVLLRGISNEDTKAVLPLANKPVAEVAPQIKITAVYSAAKMTEEKKAERGMFILKPEEINKKILQDHITTEPYASNLTRKIPLLSDQSDVPMDLDIENFLATSDICMAPNVFIISDDEENSNDYDIKNVWIQCENIDNLGWIKGTLNAAKLLSFEFPGFNPTDYYPEKEAFIKIAQVLSRKVFIPKHIQLKFQVVESVNELKNKNNMLKAEHLGYDIILTTQGLRHKTELIEKTHSRSLRTVNTMSEETDVLPSTSTEKTTDIINGLRQKSKMLESENDLLWNEAVINKDKILQSLTEVSDGLRHEMSETLRNIMLANREDK